MREEYVEVRVPGTGETDEPLADFLFSEGALGLLTEDAPGGTGGVLIRATFRGTVPIESIVARLRAYLKALGTLGLTTATGHIEVRAIPIEDWGRAWKAHFGPLPVGRRLVIAPPWEAGPFPADRRIVRIDPGMSFGTGHHATTRMCLEALEAFLEGWRGPRPPHVLDVGTGTGILAIAAAALGAGRVVALDSDAEACAAAASNGALNAGADRVRILCGGPEVLKAGAAFDLVVANLDAKTLYLLVDILRGLLACRGCLVISGVLMEEEDEIRSAARPGLQVIARTEDEGWRCLSFVSQVPAREGREQERVIS